MVDINPTCIQIENHMYQIFKGCSIILGHTTSRLKLTIEGIGNEGGYEPDISKKDAEEMFEHYNIFALNAYKTDNKRKKEKLKKKEEELQKL